MGQLGTKHQTVNISCCAMGSTLVYGDGVDDIKEFFTDTFSRGSRRETGSSVCSRPVIIGALLFLWLFCLSVSLIVVASKYQNLSVTSLSSRLDSVDSKHNTNHAQALQRIGQVDSHHRQTIGQLGDTVDQVGKLQGKVRQSLKELKIFLNGMGTVANNAVKELNSLKFE